MNEYVLYILCSDNKPNNFIERCIKSIDTEIDDNNLKIRGKIND